MKVSFGQLKSFDKYIEKVKDDLFKEHVTSLPKYVHKGQQQLLASNEFNILVAGTKGSGKSRALVMDFLKDVGKGYGTHYKGFLVRVTLKELNNLIDEVRQVMREDHPDMKCRYGDRVFRFSTGETLELVSARTKMDSYKFKGQNASWIGFDELTSWRTPEVYEMASTDIRSKVPGLNPRIRAATNSEGPGKQWVKRMFVSPAPVNVSHGPEGAQTKYMEFYTTENRALIENDPYYSSRIVASLSDKKTAKEFTEIDWSNTDGLFFGEVWKKSLHVMRPFKIPHTWRKTRTCDWGTNAPFSVSWGAKSDGTDYQDASGVSRPTRKGDIYIFANLYGNHMVYEKNPLGRRIPQLYGETKNEFKQNCGVHWMASRFAKIVLEIDKKVGGVNPGAGDSNISNRTGTETVADAMAKEGLYWTKPNKAAGSIEEGLQSIKARLINSINGDERGIFFFDNCHNVIRTIEEAPTDELNPNKIIDVYEDHAIDELRYRLQTEYSGQSRSADVQAGYGY